MRYAAACVVIVALAGPSWCAGPPVIRRDASGDPLPSHSLFRLGTDRFRAPGDLWIVALSPDGRLAAASGSFPGVCLWDLPSGRLRARLKDSVGHSSRNVCFSPDGKTLTATNTACPFGESPHNGFRVWDATSGELRVAGSVPGKDIAAWVFLPDGKVLAGSRLDKGLMLFDVVTGRNLRTIASEEVAGNRIAFSPDGTLLAVPMLDATVVLYRVASGKVERALPPDEGRVVLDLAFSPDGRRVATLPQKGGIRVWDLRTGQTGGRSPSTRGKGLPDPLHRRRCRVGGAGQ